MLSRYTPKLDGSKISNIPIDRVYPIYVHYGKFKGKPTYPNAINLYLQDTQVFSCVCFNNSLSHSCGGLLGFSKCEWEKKRENMKSEGTTLEGKWKVICKMQVESHFSHIGKRNGNCCPYGRKHFHYFLKEIRRRCPLAPSSSLDSALALIDKFFGQNLFNQFLLNQINLVNIMS